MDAYLAHLNRVIPKHDLARLRDLTADGYFSKVKFVEGVVALKLDLISKLRRDADARYLYTGPYAGRGPPAATPVRSIGPAGTRRCLPPWLPPTRRSASKPPSSISPAWAGASEAWSSFDRRTQRIALLFSTDLDLDPVTLYRYDKARFQIEFLFRDSKPFAGLTHGQARRTDALTFQVNASLTAVSLSKLQAVQTYGHLPTPFSMASLVRRCFNAHFLKKILAYLASGQTLTENSPEYETLCNYGIINPVPT